MTFSVTPIYRLVGAFILTSLYSRTMATPTVPSNVALVVGSNTTLHCAAGETFQFVFWSFVATGTSAPVAIISGPSCTALPGIPQYQVNSTDATNGQCDLIINDVTPSEAGWYECYTVTSSGAANAVLAQVTVLYSSPNCSQNVTSDVAVGDDVLMKCEVSYSSEGMTADMTWTGCQYHDLSTSSNTAGIITTTYSEIYVVAKRPYLEVCTCNTTTGNPPSLAPMAGEISSSTEIYSSTWNSEDDILVQYCSDNVTVSPSTNSILPPNSTVTCQANGYPASTFHELSAVERGEHWTMVTVSNSSSLTLCREGAYNVTCRATSYITSAQQGSFTCMGESLVYLYSISSSASTTPSASGARSTTKNVPISEPSCSCATTGVVTFFVVIGVEVIAIVSTLVVCRYKSGCPLYRNVAGSKDTMPQKSSNANHSGIGNANSTYETLQPRSTTNTQLAINSRGNQQTSQTGSSVDPTDVVYTELQLQQQAKNRTGNRQSHQAQADDTYENSQTGVVHKHQLNSDVMDNG